MVWFHLYRVDVTELQIAGIVIFIISGIFGVQIWSLQVRHVSIIGQVNFGSFRKWLEGYAFESGPKSDEQSII